MGTDRKLITAVIVIGAAAFVLSTIASGKREKVWSIEEIDKYAITDREIVEQRRKWWEDRNKRYFIDKNPRFINAVEAAKNFLTFVASEDQNSIIKITKYYYKFPPYQEREIDYNVPIKKWGIYFLTDYVPEERYVAKYIGDSSVIWVRFENSEYRSKNQVIERTENHDAKLWGEYLRSSDTLFFEIPLQKIDGEWFILADFLGSLGPYKFVPLKNKPHRRWLSEEERRKYWKKKLASDHKEHEPLFYVDWIDCGEAIYDVWNSDMIKLWPYPEE